MEVALMSDPISSRDNNYAREIERILSKLSNKDVPEGKKERLEFRLSVIECLIGKNP